MVGVFVLLLTTASCGSSGGASNGASGGGGGSTTIAGPGGGSSSDGSTDGGGRTSGKVDCAAIKTAAPDLIVSVQLLAQLTTPGAVASVKDHTVGNFDADRFLASMKTLHSLDGTKSVVGGNVKDSINAYEQAATKAKVLLAANPPSQAQLDDYAKGIGSIQDFLRNQSTISGAIATANC